MNRPITILGVLATLVAFVGCGQIVPQDDHTCPCTSGWMCCSGTCVEGAKLGLGTASIAEQSDASDSPGVDSVMGMAVGVLEASKPIGFDYATSIWPTPTGYAFSGWLLDASADQSFHFQVAAMEDGGASVSLPLMTYGPLEANDTTCTGAPQGAPMLAGTVEWNAANEGTYFVAAYHAVTETPNGLAFQGLRDQQYAHAFIVVTSTVDAGP